MRVVLAIIVPVLAALFQGSVTPLVEIAGIRPSLVLLVAAAWSVAAGAREGMWWAFVGGLAADLLSGSPLGALPLAAIPAVAIVGLGDPGRPAGLLAGSGAVGLADLVAGALHTAIVALTGVPLPPLGGLLSTLLGGALYTGVLAVVAYPVLQLVRRRTEPQAFGA